MKLNDTVIIPIQHTYL